MFDCCVLFFCLLIEIVEIALDPDCVNRKKTKLDKKNDNTNNNSNNNNKNNNNSKIPETYYIVTNNKYIKQRGMIVWCKTAKEEKREKHMSFWVVLLYVVVILFAVLYQMDWKKVSRKINIIKHKWARF